ncbi:hypothetical protein ACFP81_05890 [Deinococcus lacus]|uniref:Tetratricopeptide repeat protein n=1 Tax=Deinococcus lacus TaxID=392561 RepID=A0ABW1YC29_9DEIO
MTAQHGSSQAEKKSLFAMLEARLDQGQRLAAAGQHRRALDTYRDVLALLRRQKPTPGRDGLLAAAYLLAYQSLRATRHREAGAQLQRGVSYARTSRDPQARALAQACLESAGE